MKSQEYYDKHREQVLMLGVDIGPPEQAVSLLQTLKITYPAVTTADEHVQDDYKLLGLPATYFINSRSPNPGPACSPRRSWRSWPAP